MAEKVTYKNLFSESWKNVFELIKANVSDPISSSAQFRKWIFPRIPDVKNGSNFSYPFIVVYPSNIDVGEERSSLDGKSKEVSFEIQVEVFSSDRGYPDGKGLYFLDIISNSIFDVFLDETNRSLLRANSLYFSKPETQSVTQDVLANELVYRRSVLLPFKCKMEVSA